MIKTSFLLSLVMTTGLVNSLSAAPIALFNTGTNGTGVDQHYFIGFSSDSSVAAGSSVTGTGSVSFWAAALSGSSWINPSGNANQNYCPDYYAFTTSFDLTGLNPVSTVLTGSVMADDHVSIYLNNTWVSNLDFGSYTQPTNFTIGSQYSSAFQSGTNYLSFVVKNDGGPMGLDATLSGVADVAAPEPGGFGLVEGSGVFLVSVAIYRKRTTRKTAADLAPVNYR